MARRVARNSPGDRLRQVSRKCETPLEDLVDKSGRDLSVEQVAHAVHEDNPRLLPPKRHAERFGMDLDAEARAAGTTSATRCGGTRSWRWPWASGSARWRFSCARRT